MRAFLGVEAAFLHAAFCEIDARHGSVESYLEAVLGVGPKLRDRISGKLCA